MFLSIHGLQLSAFNSDFDFMQKIWKILCIDFRKKWKG